MTSEFGTWRNPLECERLAQAYWNDGALFPPKPLHRPRIGQPWPADFIPYWRTYIDRPIPPHRPYFYAWGSIRDTEFWRKLSIRLTNDTILSCGISWAGMVGNVEAFQAMTSTVLNDYSKAILESPGLKGFYETFFGSWSLALRESDAKSCAKRTGFFEVFP